MGVRGARRLTLLTDDLRVFVESGENDSDLVWVGRPAGGVRFRRQDLFLVPFSLTWGGFAVVWESLALRSDGPWFLKLWGIPFVFIGLYMIFGRFLWDAYSRSRTWYALTNDSAIILRRHWRGGLQRIYLPSLSNICLTTNNDELGTILFGNEDRQGGWGSWNPPQQSFQFIKDARKVYDVCARAQRSAGQV
jgi:hypothetical protein